MKKLIYLSVILGCMLVGCNPMEDIYNDIDAQENPIVGNAEYTLTDTDYTALDLELGSFESENQAKELLPAFLSERYPYWGNGSSVLIGYNLYITEGVSNYTTAENYALQSDDYPTAGSNAFFPNQNPATFVDDVLAEKIASPIDGQVVFVEYKQFVNQPEVGYANIPQYDYGFNASFNNWTVTDVLGAQGWTPQPTYAEGNGYSGGQVANEDWLISPSIDLTSETDIKFQINQAINYATDISLLKILVSTNYTGNIATASWNEINLATAPAGNSNDFIVSEEFNFNAYAGQTINIALKYKSTDTDAARWRVDQLAIKRVGITGPTNTLHDYYVYDGGVWKKAEGVYYLTAADYDAMGTTSGQPGQYNNFSGTALPENYLPTFLDVKYPFAQEEDEMIVIYKWYNGAETQTRGRLYTFSSGVWEPLQSTLQFGHDGTQWIPDNTIRHTLTGTDYDTLADHFTTVAGFENAAISMGNYGNLDRRVGNAAYWTDEMIITAMGYLLDNVVATNAEDGQKYIVTFAIYNGTNTTEDFKLIKEAGEWISNQ
ncbi:choice-of-anchor J domain-containing protein [Flavobacterium sp. SM2513]|uniref:choice-of-anchor J domain-containing protein n=1 Tax=Flavobacterium sp. SM2513 TaxID=3424766 RepID=UPI003D7F90CA